MPKVSVCVPTFNYANYIGDCIQSVLSQTYEDWELLVVDNHSSDGTAEVVRSFRDPRIRYFQNEENIGLVRNWKRSVSLATGGYIALLPADDAYLPRMLERSVAVLDKHPEMGFTYSSYHVIDEHGRFVQLKRQWEEDRVLAGKAAVQCNLPNANFAIPPTVLMRRQCYDEVGGYDETYRLIIDWVLYMQVALRFDVGYVAEPLALHRYQHPSSVSAQTYLKRPRLITDEELRLLREVLPRLPADVDSERFRRRVFRGVINRHMHRTYGLLVNDEMEEFRAELWYAMGLDPSMPFRYRKMTALWIASLLGARAAKRLDSAEKSFWEALRNLPSDG